MSRITAMVLQRANWGLVVCSAVLAACGARTALDEGNGQQTGGSNVGGAAAGGVSTGGVSVGGTGGEGGEPEPLPCLPGEVLACGTNEGLCIEGERFCDDDGFFGECMGSVEPVEEACNDLDDDCDGTIDNGFGLGLPCDGPDSDECTDDIMTCDGCTLGDDTLEICNGVDDNCNGTIDSDCDVGGCMPTLLVVDSTPSDPNCIDFEVEAGSTGTISYPCEGGPVSATLGAITFNGSVNNGNVSLFGTATIVGPDNCLWQTNHFIQGSLPSGTITYSYEEILLTTPGFNCWNPCTEIGTVDITW